MIERLPLTLVCAAIGLALGPLFGIAVDRVVERLPFRPEHRCTTCRAGQGGRSLIPVLSWFGACPQCSSATGRRYPMVDLATAGVFALLALRLGPGFALVPYLGFGAVLVVLSAIDFETHLLPNRIVWPSFWSGLVVIVAVSLLAAYGDGISSALLGAAVFGGFIGLAHVIYEPGMGRGDVKLSLVLGLFIGWLQPSLLDTARLVLITIVAALLGGGLLGLAVNALRGRGRAEIPFGPALAAASLAAVVVAPVLVGPVRF